VDQLPGDAFVCEPTGNAVGCTRLVRTPDGSKYATETCLAAHPTGNTYSLALESAEVNPLPFMLHNYICTVKATDVGENRCLFTAQSTFRSNDVPVATETLTGMYTALADAVAAKLEAGPPPVEVFFILNTRGTRVAWLLEELQYPYTHTIPSLGSWMGMTLTSRDLMQATYAKMGHDFSRLLQIGLKAAGVPDKMANKVPVTNIGGVGFMFESSAIGQTILEHPAIGAGRLSGTAKERPQLLQWMNFGETIMEHSSSKVITGGLWNNGPDSKQLAMDAARAGMAGQADMIERELNEHGCDYLLPSGFSAADVWCGFSLINSFKRGLIDLDDDVRYPKTWAWAQRCQEREGTKRAWARTKVFAAGKYTCVPGKEPVLVPGTEGDFEDPAPDWMPELIAKYGPKK